MKQLFILFALLFSIIQVQAQPIPQDTSDVLWQKYIPNSGDEGRAVKFTIDGKHIIAGCNPNIYILKTETGEIEKTLIGHTGKITCLAVSQTGTMLASGTDAGSEDGRVILWNLMTGDSIHIFSDLKELPPIFGELSSTSGLTFTPDGKFLIGSSINKDIYNLIIWNLSDFTIYKKFSCQGSNQYMCISSDGQYLAISNEITNYQNIKSFHLIIWKIGEDFPFKTIGIQSEGGDLSDWIGKVQFSNDGKYLFVVCSKSVTILNTSDFSVKNVIKPSHGPSAAFYPNLPLIVNGLTILDINTLKIIYNFSLGYGNDEDIDLGSKYLVFGGNGTVQLYNLGVVGVKENPIEPDSLNLKIIPNPINKELNISFDSPASAITLISIYSLNGELIKTVTNQLLAEGHHQIIERIDYLSSGNYYCRIQLGNIIESLQFIINK